MDTGHFEGPVAKTVGLLLGKKREDLKREMRKLEDSRCTSSDESKARQEARARSKAQAGTACVGQAIT